MVADGVTSLCCGCGGGGEGDTKGQRDEVLLSEVMVRFEDTGTFDEEEEDGVLLPGTHNMLTALSRADDVDAALDILSCCVRLFLVSVLIG